MYLFDVEVAVYNEIREAKLYQEVQSWIISLSSSNHLPRFRSLSLFYFILSYFILINLQFTLEKRNVNFRMPSTLICLLQIKVDESDVFKIHRSLRCRSVVKKGRTGISTVENHFCIFGTKEHRRFKEVQHSITQDCLHSGGCSAGGFQSSS